MKSVPQQPQPYRRLRDSLLIKLITFSFCFGKKKCGQHISLTKQLKLRIASLLRHKMVLNVKNWIKKETQSISVWSFRFLEAINKGKNFSVVVGADLLNLHHAGFLSHRRPPVERWDIPRRWYKVLPVGLSYSLRNPDWDLNNVRYIHIYILRIPLNSL